MDYNFGIEPSTKNLTPFRTAFKDQYGRAATIDETRNWLGLKPIDEFRAENPDYLPPSMQGVPNARETSSNIQNQTAGTQTGGAVRNLFDGINSAKSVLDKLKGIYNSGQPQGASENTSSGLVDIFQPDKFSSSWSGLPMERREEILAALVPKLLSSVENYEGNIDKSTQAAQELFQSQTRQGMKGTLKEILNNLASKNVLNSSVGSDAISKGMSNVVRAGADKGYETSMNNAALKAQLPALLANITQLGGGSFSSDPLEPYKLLAQYDWNMM